MVHKSLLNRMSILPQARQGFGTVHHAAFRVEDRAVLEEWIRTDVKASDSKHLVM